MSSNTTPKPCKHLVDYKQRHGLDGFSMIQKLIKNSPYGSHRSKSDIARCRICCKHQGRLYICLICSSVSCCSTSESESKNHALSHIKTNSGHEISVDIQRAELYCFGCSDQVYDPDFDKAVMSQNGLLGFSELNLRLGGGGGGKRKRLSLGGMEISDSEHFKRIVSGRDRRRSKSCFPFGLRGLNNLGNTCFMNSVLQALLHTPPFRNYFLSHRHSGHGTCRCNKSSSGLLCLPCDIDGIFAAVFSGDRVPYSPARFLYSWWRLSENLACYEQQDAHEFFISVLDRIHEKEGKPRNTAKDNGDCNCIAHRVFSGLLRSDVSCTTCGYTSTTYDPCLDISLDLSTNTSNSTTKDVAAKASRPTEIGISTLATCLDLFTRPEKLGSDQKLYCQNCQEKRESVKQMSIKRLPLVLSLHVKRFEHSAARKMSRKIDRHLQFPFSLDMTPYLSSSIVRKRFGNRIFAFEGDEHDISTNFEVFAVITHSGMLESGHYVTYLRLNEQWYKCDDAWITEVDDEVVRTLQSYLIFYMQKVVYRKASEELSCLPRSPRGDTFVPIAGCC